MTSFEKSPKNKSVSRPRYHLILIHLNTELTGFVDLRVAGYVMRESLRSIENQLNLIIIIFLNVHLYIENEQ